jgi:hypothetical protein
MNVSEATASPDFTGQTGTQLHGRWVTAVHIIWVVLIICTLIIFFASLPVYFSQLQLPCQVASCASGQLSSSTVHSLHALGLSIKGYATLSLLLGMAWSSVWFAVAGILAWRKYNDWMALLTALMLVMQGSESILSTVAGSSSFWQFPALLVGFLAYLLLSLVLVIFPDGRFVPRWTYWLVVIYIPVSVQFNFFANKTTMWVTLSDNLLFVGLVISLIVIQVYRYWRVSNLVERQQTKWIVFCITLLLVMVVVTALLPALNQPGSFYSLIFGSSYSFPSLLIPLSFGVAILRYRLYDIDIIINRTLVYGTLTAILALVYFGLIFALQYLLRGIINQQNDVAIVVSTLAIAALFQPLRRRIQQVIDRRFYRRKYDAAKTVEVFSATLRSEVDLQQLREQLLNVVQETMQPAHVSLWLRPPEHDGTHQAPWRANPYVDSKEG